MSLTIIHAFVDTVPDDPALTDCVRPSDWNAEHVVFIADTANGKNYTITVTNGVLGLEEI